MADSILTPCNAVDTNKLAKQMKAQFDAQPKIDNRTAEDLKIELRGLTDRMESHEELRDNGEEQLKELRDRFAAKTNALNVARDMVKVQPRLRGDIRDLERAIEGLTEEIKDGEAFVKRHSNIADDLAKKIKAFDHKRLKQLEAQEKVLQQAGL
ncbi:MAG: hypothetical protein LAP86_06575 [Acidobacteriia bacterium]|nr:hypothetical protein [Terriglobia bacterium]